MYFLPRPFRSPRHQRWLPSIVFTVDCAAIGPAERSKPHTTSKKDKLRLVIFCDIGVGTVKEVLLLVKLIFEQRFA